MRNFGFLGLLLAVGGFCACGENLTMPVEREPYVSGQLEPLTCVPNLDGRIEAHELSAAYDLPVSYLVAPDGEQRAVDVEGEVNSSGVRVWDWGADHASDQVARLSASLLSGKWYADSFPNASFVVPFDLGGTVEAIYSQDEQGFYLWGMASKEEQPQEGQTLLVYDTPVSLFRFPLQPGDGWVSVGEMSNGTFRGLPYAGRDTYEVEVDGSGRLILPDLTFTQVLRVRTRTVLEPAVGQSTSQRQVGFLFECYGEVARATSQLDEAEADFTTALEVRRLGL